MATMDDNKCIIDFPQKLFYIAEGQFDQFNGKDVLHGFGRQVFMSGYTLIGNFREGKLHGYGIQVDENGEKHDGLF